MYLNVTIQNERGLKIELANVDSGRKVDLQHVIKQVENGNPNYKTYVSVHNSNGATYLAQMQIVA